MKQKETSLIRLLFGIVIFLLGLLLITSCCSNTKRTVLIVVKAETINDTLSRYTAKSFYLKTGKETSSFINITEYSGKYTIGDTIMGGSIRVCDDEEHFLEELPDTQFEHSIIKKEDKKSSEDDWYEKI